MIAISQYEECPTKNDVMGAEDSGSRRYGLSMFSSAKSIKSKSTVFTLGKPKKKTFTVMFMICLGTIHKRRPQEGWGQSEASVHIWFKA